MRAIWLNGSVVDADAARLSPFDHGFTVGDGVFETLDLRRGRPFATRRHLLRLRRSAEGLDLELPSTDDELRAAMDAVCRANSVTEGRLRVTVTSGPGPVGSARGEGPPTVLVTWAAPVHVAATAVVATMPWPRNERGALTGLKTTSYAENVKALAIARGRGASEAIFGNLAGNLCEGTGSNVFLAVDGRLVTPPLSAGCLAGVTRELLCELVEVDECDTPLDALARSREAFLASTTRDLQPIASVDGTALAAAPGPLSQRAADAFAALVARDLDP